MTFTAGDQVHVAGLGKGVVREVRKGGRCLVEIKGRAMLVDATHLSGVEGRRGRSKPTRGTPSPVAEPRGHAPASIDLHGLTPDAAMEALDAFINDAILAGHESVRVVHGRGAGRLKAAVHKRLAAISAVRHVRVDPANAGVTLVTL
jgi:DNA mismatch repair protein MutS2